MKAAAINVEIPMPPAPGSGAQTRCTVRLRSFAQRLLKIFQFQWLATIGPSTTVLPPTALENTDDRGRNDQAYGDGVCRIEFSLGRNVKVQSFPANENWTWQIQLK